MSPSPRLALAVLLVGPFACAPSPQSADSDDGTAVVARIGGDAIHASELDAWLRNDLYEQATADKDAADLYEFRHDGLERMVMARLLAEEAGRRGLPIAELHAQTAGPADVSDEEVQAFYDDNRERLVDSGFEELAPRIRSYLGQRKQADAWNAFLDGLRERAGVELLLEPPRLDVATVGPALGPADAPVTIIEFSDFNCPFCQRVAPTLKALLARYPDQLRLVFRHYPLPIHTRARAIAEAAVCADDQGAFWAFHDRIFEDPQPLADEAIRKLAGTVGLDLTAFDSCLAAGGAANVVQRDVDAGAAAGVTGTPAFFVNGIRMSGAQPLEAFERVIDDEIARSEPSAETPPSS